MKRKSSSDFVYEKAARELSISITGISAPIEADFDPRGLCKID